MADLMQLVKGGNVAREPESTNLALTGADGREPKRKPKAGEKGSPGDQAFNDAVLIVAIAWAVLIFLAFSLRNHNI